MNDTLETRVLRAMRRLMRATDLDAKQLARETHLSTSQLLVMELLAVNGALTIGGLSERVGLAQATVTAIVDRLLGRALVRKWRSTEDRRQAQVALTEQGRQLFARAPTALQTRFLDNFGQIKDWEKMAILSALDRLAELMEAEHVDASPVLDTGVIDD